LQERQTALQARQSELESLRKEREVDVAKRAEIDKQNAATIAEAQKKRQEAEDQAAQLKQQAETSARQAERSARDAEAAQQQAQAAQQQALAARDAQQKSAQQTADVQAELEKTRKDLATQTAEAHRLRLQQSLAKFATTRADTRGVIVTLPSMLFDPGKSALKS